MPNNKEKCNSVAIVVSPPPILNFLQKTTNECIICLDEGDLVKNNKCECIYYYHVQCANKLNNPLQCILCKKDAVQIPIVQNVNQSIQTEELTSSTICNLICVLVIVGIIIASFFLFGTSSK
jgi:hypothetical protein